jgi:hypothetical protein
MDRREIRPGLTEVRDQTPAQRPFDRLTRLGGPVGRRVAISWACLVDPCGGHAAEPRLKAEGLGLVRPNIYVRSRCLFGVATCPFAQGICRPHGRPWAAGGYIRETSRFHGNRRAPRQRPSCGRIRRAPHMSEVERWRELPDGTIEFTMRRLRIADDLD